MTASHACSVPVSTTSFFYPVLFTDCDKEAVGVSGTASWSRPSTAWRAEMSSVKMAIVSICREGSVSKGDLRDREEEDDREYCTWETENTKGAVIGFVAEVI